MPLAMEKETSNSSVLTATQEEQWRLAERIACSRYFSRSQFLSRFLLYVCDRKLQNRVQEITEQQIGVSVFGRPIGYDCGEDNIVRNYARTLRKRLEEYFETEGAAEKWIIQIPRGGYAPIFSLSTEKEAQEPHLKLVPSSITLKDSSNPIETGLADTENKQKTINEHSHVPLYKKAKPLYLGIGFALFVLLVIGSATIFYALHSSSSSNAHLLWKELFTKNQSTLLVPADSGVGILQNFTKEPVHVDTYQAGSYLNRSDANRTDARSLRDLRTQRYTSVVDLDIILALSRLPEAQEGRPVVRFARDLAMDEMKNANVILLGSSRSNPWVEIFEKELNFHFIYGSITDESYIKNEHPLSGEQATYSNEWNSPSHKTYALVALRPNLSGNGWVLLLEGLNMAGTEAAAETLLHNPDMQDVLEKAMKQDHRLHPFELLIETTSLGAQPGRAKIVAQRIN